ncbi:MAG: PEP-CTERM sorting domain-containing protein [Desulfobacteraceae bacterium]|nr:PEP-CTERM sorting domain-containing protein [Desulfobacteraceae bacterium]
MKKCLKVSLLLFLSLFIVSASAMAATTTETDLQTIFDSKTWVPDPQTAWMTMPGAWTLPTASGGFTMTFYHENPNGMEFGIYSTDLQEEATVFDSFDTPKATAVVSFSLETAWVLQFWDADALVKDIYFDHYDFTGKKFGFWFGDGKNKYYSDASRNDLNGDNIFGGKEDIALQVYKAGNGSYVFAGDIDGDKDFDDIVVQASSIKPVSTPAPTSMLLLGLGVLGLIGITRRK